jgi:hypothetical protein
MKCLMERINTLPPHLRAKVEDFVDDLEQESELTPDLEKRL